ncbi:MAG: dihydropteroate synthase [Desulfobacteraceae bacterium]|nr:MAG: dihydropteroate synthase [Desulfobacteraceae bacterium]
MGVLNVTPDSFSDGGRYLEREAAVEQGLRMAAEGADILDIGGESTRPYAQEVSEQEELDRVIPVIHSLAREVNIPISIDTIKAGVAREALRAGACMINDVSALALDPAMAPLAAETGVPVILMHMKGIPRTMQENPVYEDVVSEIMEFLKSAEEKAVRSGVSRDLIILDPGIGFGKSFDHNLTIIRELRRFSVLKRPLLLGPSRKAFLGHILGNPALDRDNGTMATVAVAVLNGAHIVRVHNVKSAVETVKVADAIRRGGVGEKE